MKILLVGLYEENEYMSHFYDFLNLIYRFSIPIVEGEERDNSNFIYLENYKYSRLDQKLIEYIESESIKCIYGYFYCSNIDERFTNSKYYNIETKKYEKRGKQVISETLIINYDDIVDDLYHKRYIYNEEEE